MTSDSLNAAALRMAQGAEPTNDLERMIQTRMRQLTEQPSDPNMRAYKKGGTVKAYKKGGLVAKGKAPPFGKVPAGKMPAPKNGKAPPPFGKMPVATNIKPAGGKTPSAVAGTGTMRSSMPKQVGAPPMFKKGGVVKKAAPEGSAKDMREDKKFAKKAGMSMAKWEKSAADKKHDAGKKPFKKGGAVKKGRC